MAKIVSRKELLANVELLIDSGSYTYNDAMQLMFDAKTLREYIKENPSLSDAVVEKLNTRMKQLEGRQRKIEEALADSRIIIAKAIRVLFQLNFEGVYRARIKFDPENWKKS